MPAQPMAIPLCQNQLDKEKPPCRLPMFRIGTQTYWAWVCEKCDNISRDNSLDVGTQS